MIFTIGETANSNLLTQSKSIALILRPFDVEEPFNVSRVYFGSNNLVAVLIIPGQQVFYLTMDERSSNYHITKLDGNYVTLWDEFNSYVHVVNKTLSAAYEVAKPYIVFDIDESVTETQATLEIGAFSKF